MWTKRMKLAVIGVVLEVFFAAAFVAVTLHPVGLAVLFLTAAASSGGMVGVFLLLWVGPFWKAGPLRSASGSPNSESP